jgi:uncharacterized phage protein (TIGR02220 family)
MAMEYARLYFDFFTSEKTQFLLDECGSEGVVCLQRLWVRAGQRNNDGVFNKTGRALEKIAGWKGESGKLVGSLTDPDFMFLEKISDNEYRLHNWLENNEHLSDKAKEMRVDKARRAANARWGNKEQDDATGMPLECSKDAKPMPVACSSMLGDANLTKHNVTELKVSTKDSVDENPKPDKKKELAQQIIDHFNKITGRDNGTKRPITLTGKTKSQIMARIKEGYRIDDFKKVTEVCYYNWKDTEFSDRIHPITIFNSEMDKRIDWQRSDVTEEETLPQDPESVFFRALPSIIQLRNNKQIHRDTFMRDLKEADEEQRAKMLKRIGMEDYQTAEQRANIKKVSELVGEVK